MQFNVWKFIESSKNKYITYVYTIYQKSLHNMLFLKYAFKVGGLIKFGEIRKF